ANSDLQNLFQSTRIATVFVDRELRIKKFTPDATEVFRLIDADVGRPITDISSRFPDGEMVDDVREVLRTLTPRERHVYVPDTSSWYLLRILPYRTVEDVIDGVVVTLVDVTDLKRAQEQRGLLAAIVESSQDAVIGKTLDGIVTSWNAAAERMYGYSAWEAIGRPVDFLVPPERRGELAPVFAKLAEGEEIGSFETVRFRKDGTPIDIFLTLSPVRDASGRIVGVSGIDRDVSERKRVREALQESEAKLRERTEQLIEADHRKDEFLAMLGHELRNPLAPIRNCLHLLELPQTTSEQAERARATIERQVLHLTRLVDDLLDISRISRGKILIRHERTDLTEVVRATAEDQRHGLEEQGIELVLDLPDRPVGILGDPTRLSQTVGNVLHNAGKFTDAGGRVAVSLRVEPETGTAVVSVEDTGIGMEPELLPSIFEPFSQADRGPDRSRGGLGLGLALVRALVEMHGGTVSAASDGPGRGSELRIRLPLAGEAEAADPEPQVASPRNARPRRCLVIEDNADAAESMALLLELSGHEVAVAHDGVQGLERARELRPEVVLCDIGLPGELDGYGVARAFRADPDLAAACLIALTGYGQEEDRRRALEAGFNAHLTKPADLDALKRLVEECGLTS
ncbi:MAG TPA: PAS domain-containing protein, partial [Thermoanaerobaculia bacterium]|nr:PAS domain-containing protein [Thermoanaerobaculia bacterium]